MDIICRNGLKFSFSLCGLCRLYLSQSPTHGGLTMRRFFYRPFPISPLSVPAKCIIGVAIGFCAGIIMFQIMPHQPLCDLTDNLIAAEAGIGHCLFTAVVPLLFAFALFFFGLKNLARIAVCGLCGFLLTFSAAAIGVQFPALVVWLLLLGRCLVLIPLFWFLLYADLKNPRVLTVQTCLCTIVSMLLSLFANWLTSPGIQVFAAPR